MAFISAFDVIGPNMIGPSSSHTAGAIRLGLLARNIYNEQPDKVTFKLYNSFARTGKGHGTDKGLLSGVLGLNVDDTRIKDIFEDADIKKTSINLTKVYILLKQVGITLDGIENDISVGAYILNPTNNKLDLKNLAMQYLELLCIA